MSTISPKDPETVVSDENSLTPASSYHPSLSSQDSNTDEHLVRPLEEEEDVPNVHRVHTLRDQIRGDNQSILEEEEQGRNDLDKSLLRQFSIQDAMLLKTQSHVTNNNNDDDEESILHQIGGGDTNTRRNSIVEKVYTNATTGEVDLPPDGGYGWICMICSSAMMFGTWGNNSAFGVFLAFYLDNEVFPGATSMDFAWIAGLLVLNAQIFSPVAVICDNMFGFKRTMAMGGIISFIGYILASFATELWQLYVCQGVIVGMAYSFLIVPANTIIPNWFLKKRAIASGILSCGTGLGGLTYSLSINAMIQRTGDQRWSLRMCAISTSVIFAISIFFIKRRNQPPRLHINKENVKNVIKVLFSPDVIKSSRLWFIIIWFVFTIVGYNVVLFSYASSATAMGFTQHQASVFTAMINAFQAMGRPSIGIVSDKFVGRVNYTGLLNVLNMVLILGFWMNAHTFAQLLVCAMFLGFFLGNANVMNTVLTADVFKPEEFPGAWSVLNMGMGISCLFVEVIALSLRDNSLSNPFVNAQIFAGCCFAVGVLFLVPLREWHIKRLLNKRLHVVQRELDNVMMNEKMKPSSSSSSRSEEELKVMVANYEGLLKPSARAYVLRAAYPVKV